jgi:hypothetical protein
MRHARSKIAKNFKPLLASLRLRSMAMLEVPDVLRGQRTQNLRKEFGRQADADSQSATKLYTIAKMPKAKYDL